MRTIAILAASAFLLAAAIVEIPSRLWAGEPLALLVVAFIALFAQGWLGSRVLNGSQSAPAADTKKSNARPQKKADKRPAKAPAKDQKTRASHDADTPSGPRESGTVKWFNRSKGFGFIVRESGEEIFVHQRSIRSEGSGNDQRRPSLRDGQSVSFVVVEREKGQQAEDVTADS